MNLTAALQGLRDVDQVHGSFVLGSGGKLVARDLPALFDGQLLAEVGARIARLRETFDPPAREPAHLTLRYAEHKLYVRTTGAQLLCVLTGSQVNGPALRMAMNLVVRRLDAVAEPHELQDALTPAPVATPAAGRSTPIPPPAPPSSRREILYRGRRLG